MRHHVLEQWSKANKPQRRIFQQWCLRNENRTALLWTCWLHCYTCIKGNSQHTWSTIIFPPCKKCVMQRKTIQASMAAEHAERSWVAFNIRFDDVPKTVVMHLCMAVRTKRLLEEQELLGNIVLHTKAWYCTWWNMFTKQNQHNHELRKQQDQQHKRDLEKYLGQTKGKNPTHFWHKMQSAGKVGCGRGMASCCWASGGKGWAWEEDSWAILSCLPKEASIWFNSMLRNEWLLHDQRKLKAEFLVLGLGGISDRTI